MYWRLWHGELHIPPREVDEMTTGELMLALDDDTSQRRLPEGFVQRSPEEMILHVRRLRSMTLAERVERARRGG